MRGAQRARERTGPALTLGTPGECARIIFQITGTNSVNPIYPPRPDGGGSELVAVKIGTMSWGTRTLTVPVSMLNLSASTVQLPVRLDLPSNGRTVIQPTGLPPEKIEPINHDSLYDGERWLWLVGGAGTLAPGDSTAPRDLIFRGRRVTAAT
jgi:hypothetical protein